MLDTEYARHRMVETHVARRGVSDQKVLEAMRTVPREAFVPDDLAEFAYEDTPLPIAEGQTISQPYVVARMIEAARLTADSTVLEVGGGSGYAAAVMSRIARRVFAIERRPVLAGNASRRLARLAYDNVEIRSGDGTRGWPDAAPFDAIIVSAGGPELPAALREQLAVGGRLVMPVGASLRDQRLMCVVRRADGGFDEEDLGGVRFVPLIGADGWPEEPATAEAPPAAAAQSPARLLAAAAEPLPEIGNADFAAPFDRFADRRVVLLGEASHGTAEFYRARAAITRRFVERHGFNLIAVEADWPDAAVVDRRVRGRPAPAAAEPPFRRFPTWMWRNTEMRDFIAWLERHNRSLPSGERAASFHGLDIYSMGASIEAVLAYLDRVDPAAARIARERYGCLTPWQKDPATYGRAVLTGDYRACERAVTEQCRALLDRALDYARGDGDAFLDAAQNARLVGAAERYYRVMYLGGAESWNLRDRHMFETLQHLLDARGPNAKALVWAHNSHVGDARFTEMGTVREELTLGQLCRERFGDAAALIGFGTDHGTVAAASDWGGDVEIKRVRPSAPESLERLCHETELERFLVDFGANPDLAAMLAEPRLQRFIGVIYRPDTEMVSHYADAAASRQYDAWVWFDETHAVTPLRDEPASPAGAKTWPFGT